MIAVNIVVSRADESGEYAPPDFLTHLALSLKQHLGEYRRLRFANDCNSND